MREESCALDHMELPETPDAAAQLALCFSYDGAPFAGFARQPGQHTVQGEIEQALSLALRREVEVVCAGRTDAGVHARAQVVSFPVSAEEVASLNPQRLKRSLHALTDDAIAVQSLALMPPDFSARFSALSREYRYLVVPGDRHPLFLRDWCWDVRRDLDVAAMNEAAAYLVGEHDFKSFCLAASAVGKNTVRTLDELRVVPVNVMGEDALSIRVVGNAFLHSMVRSIVGTLVMVGSGRREPAWVKTVLDACDRQAAGENAPAKGLVFWRVRYRGDVPCYEHNAVDPADGGYTPVEEESGHLEAGAQAGEVQAAEAPDAEPEPTAEDVAVVAEAPDADFEPIAEDVAVAEAQAADGAALGVASDSVGPVEAEAPDVETEPTAEDIAVAERVMDILEAREDKRGSGDADGMDDASVSVSVLRGNAPSNAQPNAPLPAAVEKAAARAHKGSMHMNDTGGKPAMPAAPRVARVHPADPMPAEGEVSLCFNVPRESASARAAKAGKQKKARTKNARGLFARLFGRRGGRDA